MRRKAKCITRPATKSKTPSTPGNTTSRRPSSQRPRPSVLRKTGGRAAGPASTPDSQKTTTMLHPSVVQASPNPVLSRAAGSGIHPNVLRRRRRRRGEASEGRLKLEQIQRAWSHFMPSPSPSGLPRTFNSTTYRVGSGGGGWHHFDKIVAGGRSNGFEFQSRPGSMFGGRPHTSREPGTASALPPHGTHDDQCACVCR
jgi:hypothetical protein